jgi:hypothetical protein
MPNSLNWSVAGLVIVALVTGASVRVAATGAAGPGHTVYVTAINKEGKAVTDLDAAEFEVKVGGKRLEVTSAEPAQAPMRIALLISDAGTGGFQGGVATFIKKLSGRAEFALISVLVQPETIVDYSSDSVTLRSGLQRLGARGLQRGAQLLETIQDATRHVRREGARPVIVVVRVGGEASTTLSGRDVREQLRKSGAILHVISTVGAQRPAPSQAREGISAEQVQLRDDEAAESALNLGMVIGDGSRESGGRHDQIISTTLIPTLEQLADELLNQYVLTCVLPDGAKPTDKLSVSSRRKGVTIRAPSRLPNY